MMPTPRIRQIAAPQPRDYMPDVICRLTRLRKARSHLVQVPAHLRHNLHNTWSACRQPVVMRLWCRECAVAVRQLIGSLAMVLARDEAR